MATASNSKLGREATDKPMDEMHRKILKDVKLPLVRDMEPKVVLLHMSAAHVFSDRDEGEIKAKDTRESQCEALLSILPTRGDKAFSSFLEALDDDRPFLADLVRKAAGKWVKSQKSAIVQVKSSGPKTSRPDGELPTLAVHLH